MAMATEPLVELVNKYRGEFESTAESLRQRGIGLRQQAEDTAKEAQNQLQALQPLVQQQQEKLLSGLQDQTAVNEADYAFLLDTYLWTAVLFVGLGLGQLLGGYLLAPILALFIDVGPAVLLTYVLLPAYAYLYLRKTPVSPSDARFSLLALSTLQGLLTGFLFAEKYLGMLPPPAFLQPLLVGVVAQLAGPKLQGDRRMLLGATIGSATATYLLLGLVLGQLGAAYLLFMVVYAVSTLVQIQLVLQQQRDGQADMAQTQLGALVSLVVLQSLLMFIFGGSKEAAQAAQPSE